jgi:hypothetical protein
MESYYILVRNETQIGNTRYSIEKEAILDAKLLAEEGNENTEILICKVAKIVTLITEKPKAIVNFLKD